MTRYCLILFSSLFLTFSLLGQEAMRPADYQQAVDFLW